MSRVVFRFLSPLSVCDFYPAQMKYRPFCPQYICIYSVFDLCQYKQRLFVFRFMLRSIHISRFCWMVFSSLHGTMLFRCFYINCHRRCSQKIFNSAHSLYLLTLVIYVKFPSPSQFVSAMYWMLPLIYILTYMRARITEQMTSNNILALMCGQIRKENT